MWRFEDGSVPHNVTANNNAFKSSTTNKGTYTHTFPSAGTFKYRCTIHSGMTGTVVVTP